jgi:hypothetical protein
MPGVWRGTLQVCPCLRQRWRGHLQRNAVPCADRQKLLLPDLLCKEDPVDIAYIDQISPGVARQYAGMHPRTKMRDIEALEELEFSRREEKGVSANIERITAFLPISAALD